MATGIAWADETWNPIVGCSQVSEGCQKCYAIGQAHRISAQHAGNPRVEKSVYLPDLTILRPSVPDPADPQKSIDPAIGRVRDWTGEVRVNERVLDQPLRWKRPRRVFVNSMSDLFHPAAVENRWVGDVFNAMALVPQHQFQVLTKRPKAMRDWVRHVEPLAMGEGASWRRFNMGWCHTHVWPLPNVWLGVSIESDKYTWRADVLRETPAAVRFLSLEPLLGPLPSLDLTGIDWVIVGGESGAGARPMHPDWVRDIRDQCDDAGVPFFFKQWGNWRPSAAEQHAAIVTRLGEVGWSLPLGMPPEVFQWMVRERSKNWDGHDVLDGKRYQEFPA